MPYLSVREKVLIGVIVFLIIIVSGVFYINRDSSKDTVVTSSVLEDKTQLGTNESVSEGEEQEDSEEEIGVYICGAVKNPGVYTLKKDTRLADALSLAGGTIPEADLDRINLAKKLTDEEKVYIPKKGEKIEEEQVTGTSSMNQGTSISGKVNINTATTAELDTLPGIGPSYAQRIIDYRNKNGGFKDIEEVKNVSGIGDKRFENIKDMITVD